MDKKPLGRLLAAATAGLLFAPPSAGAEISQESFLWRGNHAATAAGSVRSGVWWNEDAWDARANTERIDAGDGAFFMNVSPGFPGPADGRIDDRYVVGGDG